MITRGHAAEQLEIHSVNCRSLLPKVHRRLIADGFLATGSVIIAFAVLTIATPAFTQSALDSSSAPPTDYALPPPAGSLIEPAPRDAATSKDATPDGASPRAAPSSAAEPTTPSAATKPVTAADDSADASAAAHSGWDRVGDVYTDTNSEDRADKVLEVPQVLPPADSQPSDDAEQTAQEGGDETLDQVGSIEDYQEEEEESAVMGVYGVPVLLAPVGINSFGVSAFRSIPAPLNPNFRPRFVPGFVPIAPRPVGGGMNSAILPTSPMFPRGPIGFSGRPIGVSRGPIGVSRGPIGVSRGPIGSSGGGFGHR
jgi:hypothetical protein